MMNGLLKSRLIPLALSLALGSASSFADNNDSSDISLATLINAEPVERAVPKYPMTAARKGQEGWVRVSFVVDEEGNVQDPIVHDSSGIKAFERAAIRAVKKWKYSPASYDGEPVEQCDSKVQLDFKLHGSQKGVTRAFRSQYQALKEAIIAGDEALADELFAEFTDEAHHNYAETVHAAVVSAMYHEAKKDLPALQRELQTIANNGHHYLGDDAYITLTSKLLMLKIEQNKLSEVLELADKINATVQPDVSGLEAINELVAKVKQFVEQQDSIVVDGKIQGMKAWHHQLLLNRFDLVSKGNAFERIEIRCKNKRSTYGGVKQQGFVIPESWGQCHIYVDAPEGTEFSLVEYAS